MKHQNTIHSHFNPSWFLSVLFLLYSSCPIITFFPLVLYEKLSAL
jgi:hypothetical protein